MEHLLAASAGGGALILLYLALYVIFALGVYGAYEKAGQPGWAAFVPIYNFYILMKVAGRPTWWTWFVLLPIIPIVGSLALLVISIIVLNDVSKSFGHGGAFTVGLVLLSIIFWYILWLGPSRYLGPAGPQGRAPGGYQPAYPAAGSVPSQTWNQPPPQAGPPPPPPAPTPPPPPPPPPPVP